MLTVAVSFHITGIPFRAGTLIPTMACVVLLSLPVLWWRWKTGEIAANLRLSDPLHAGLVVFLALLVFPFTHLAGIDTYKWQDLATSIQVEQQILWLVHPLSALGFTPRSYPLLQPVLLAFIETAGDTGIDVGYYLLSLYLCAAGTFAVAFLAARVFPDRNTRRLLVLIYMLSPVFVRYLHWATGRGAFIAIFPLFLACLMTRWRSTTLAASVFAAALLILSHKVAIPALAVSVAAVVLLPLARVLPRKLVQILTAVAVILPFAVVFVSRASPLNTVVLPMISRFAWAWPFAAAGLFMIARHRERPWHLDLAWISGCASLSLAFDPPMYGAMIALPFISIPASVAADAVLQRVASRGRHIVTLLLVSALVACSIAVVVKRSIEATPHSVYQAATFLNKHDPDGPILLQGRGRTVNQVQGYLTGCPRFSFEVAPTVCISLAKPPAVRKPGIALVSEWVAYLRHPISVKGISADLYGVSPRIYRIEEGTPVPDGDTGDMIYSGSGIRIYGPSAP